MMKPLPHAGVMPCLQTTPAGHPGTPPPSLGATAPTGMPLFRTNRMPVNALRSSMRLRPGKRNRLGLGTGKRGWTFSQSSVAHEGVGHLFLLARLQMPGMDVVRVGLRRKAASHKSMATLFVRASKSPKASKATNAGLSTSALKKQRNTA